MFILVNVIGNVIFNVDLILFLVGFVVDEEFFKRIILEMLVDKGLEELDFFCIIDIMVGIVDSEGFFLLRMGKVSIFGIVFLKSFLLIIGLIGSRVEFVLEIMLLVVLINVDIVICCMYLNEVFGFIWLYG